MSHDCRCPHCRPDKPGKTWTRAHAMRCEARYVLAMRDATAHQYLEQVRAKRGQASADELAQAIDRERRGPAPQRKG